MILKTNELLRKLNEMLSPIKWISSKILSKYDTDKDEIPLIVNSISLGLKLKVKHNKVDYLNPGVVWIDSEESSKEITRMERYLSKTKVKPKKIKTKGFEAAEVYTVGSIKIVHGFESGYHIWIINKSDMFVMNTLL